MQLCIQNTCSFEMVKNDNFKNIIYLCVHVHLILVIMTLYLTTSFSSLSLFLHLLLFPLLLLPLLLPLLFLLSVSLGGSFRHFLWQVIRELQSPLLPILIQCPSSASGINKGKHILTTGPMTYSEEKLLFFFGHV